MQVLKFGGTSLLDAENILKASDIIAKAVERDRTIVVASAIGGCTDSLIEVGNMAAAHDGSFSDILDKIRARHHKIISSLLPIEKHEESLEVCDGIFESISDIAKGVSLIGELTQTSLDAIQGCGELLSTKIIATKLASIGISTKWVDSRNIIRTENIDGKNVVLQEESYNNVEKMVDDFLAE